MTAGLKAHLDLLKQEHQSLVLKYSELLRSGVSSQNRNCLSIQLQNLASELYRKDLLSDIELIVNEKRYPGHRFLLRARTDYWGDIATSSAVNFIDVSSKIFEIIYQWLYTDSVATDISDEDLLLVAEQACKFKFVGLQEMCELWLRSRLDVSNCVSIFEFAENNKLTTLSEQCSTLVVSRWTEFTKEHFAKLSPNLLYRLLKGNSDNVLRSIIQLEREDVLFLYFIDNDSELGLLLNDKSADVSPLEEALKLNYLGIANQLVQHGADVNLVYSSGDQSSIIMRMLRQQNVEALQFLCKNDVSLSGVQDFSKMLTPVQQLCQGPLSEDLLKWFSEALPRFDVNFIPKNDAAPSRSALSLACLNASSEANQLISLLLQCVDNADTRDSDGLFPLYHALFTSKRTSTAEKLINIGVNINAKVESEPLLHLLIMNLEMFKFLLSHGPDLEALDSKGYTILQHVIVSQKDIPERLEVVKALAEAGAQIGATDSEGRTVLHMAVGVNPQIVAALCPFLTDFSWTSRDQNGKTVLQLALEKKNLDSAQLLINSGAPVNMPASGDSLLIEALERSDDNTAVFLLKNNADFHLKDSFGRTPLEIALTNGLAETIRALCANGVNINERTADGYVVLEKALSNGHLQCASLLVEFDCDLNSWTNCDDGEQTLLHLMLDKRNQEAAVFLIESGVDVNAMKRFKNEADSDRQTPLHIAVEWGLTKVVDALIKHGADLNAQDKDDRTPCHVAVRENNTEALDLLLAASDVSFISTRDKLGQTPLSLAIGRKDHKSAAAIVARLPHAALQTNGNGENLLHVSVRSNDLESVLFILGTHTDPTRTTQDQLRRTALHMAANVDNELIMRNLILAECVVDARSSDGSTALHETLRARQAHLATILLENNASTNIFDDKGECAYLCAVRAGSLNCLKALVEHNCLTGLVTNSLEQTVLHICASLTTDRVEKGTTPTEICEFILKHEEKSMTEKEFAMFVDARDKNGNTALLTAFMLGNSGVCRTLLKQGATMAAKNAEGVSIFTYETPTKQLLYGLLDSLEKEPRWADADFCDCGAKFSIRQRKHHCRHCGRVVCAPCSSISMPIAKFGEEKKVRVCDMCSIVLTQGGPRF